MAKKRRKRTNNIEPFDTLLNFASGMAMHAIADKMEKKYKYNKRGVPNPYRASAYGLSTGRLNNSSDLIKLGCFLGAMGSFDDDSKVYTVPSNSRRKKLVPSYVDRVNPETIKINDNKYAWRLNCQNGSDYGIYPESFETRDEYNAAIAQAKELDKKSIKSRDNTTTKLNVSDSYNNKKYKYYKVSLIDNGTNDYYFSEDDNINVGDCVIVPFGLGESKAIVIQIKDFLLPTLPKPIEETKQIIKKID